MGKKSLSGSPKHKLIAVRLTDSEYAELSAASGSIPLSTWLRDLGLREARKKAKRKG